MFVNVFKEVFIDVHDVSSTVILIFAEMKSLIYYNLKLSKSQVGSYLGRGADVFLKC